MARKNFSLKDIKLLADRYSRLGDPETVALFQTIQSFYAPGKNPEGRAPIDPLEILKELEKSSVLLPESQEQRLTWLNSLREKLNRELFDIISSQGNPAELILGSDYTFIQVVKSPQSTPVSPVEATPQARKFKESEITFNLPDELKREFEQQLERLKEKEEQTNIQMREILAKEKELEENKVRLEQENSEFRIRLQKLREEEQKHIEQSKEQSEKETARFRQELEETREELETLRSERSNLLTEHEASRSKLDTDFSRRDQIFRAKFDEMADLMEKMFAEEKTLHKRKEQDYKSSKAKQLQIKKVSQQQAKKNQLLVKLSKSLETEKTTFKLRLKKEFEKRKEELEQEYQRKSEYHIRRLEEFEEDEERLGRENERLRIQEQ